MLKAEKVQKSIINGINICIYTYIHRRVIASFFCPNKKRRSRQQDILDLKLELDSFRSTFDIVLWTSSTTLNVYKFYSIRIGWHSKTSDRIIPVPDSINKKNRSYKNVRSNIKIELLGQISCYTSSYSQLVRTMYAPPFKDFRYLFHSGSRSHDTDSSCKCLSSDVYTYAYSQLTLSSSHALAASQLSTVSVCGRDDTSSSNNFPFSSMLGIPNRQSYRTNGRNVIPFVIIIKLRSNSFIY